MDEKRARRAGVEAAFDVGFRAALGRTELASGRVAARATNKGVVYIVKPAEMHMPILIVGTLSTIKMIIGASGMTVDLRTTFSRCQY